MASNTALAGILCLLFLLVYWVPATIAVRRQHPNAWAIYLINLVLGSTVVGWCAALIWSVRSIEDGARRKAGAGLKTILILSWVVTLVVVPAAVLVPMVTPVLVGNVEKAKVAVTKAQIQSLKIAMEQYRVDNATYPTADQGLAALLHKPTAGTVSTTWSGPYLNSGTLPLDGWKRPFLYTSDGQSFVITSLGADGIEGGTGVNADIRSTDP